MLNYLKKTNFFLNLIGVNFRNFYIFSSNIFPYFIDYIHIRKLLKTSKDFSLCNFFPILDDKFSASGTMKGHYFHQDLLIARKIYENKPKRHIDIGSRVDGFVAHVAVFREIEVFDIRKQASIKNIICKQANLMEMRNEMEQSCDSISSLHAIEHFGLGRYGDPIDINGHLKAINNIYKILKPKGKFYFSVPIGKQRIEFNAHRVFSVGYLLQLFKERFLIDSFSYVNDNGELIENAELDKNSIEVNFHCHYGCGIFELSKI